jgi:hypothetical protein
MPKCYHGATSRPAAFHSDRQQFCGAADVSGIGVRSDADTASGNFGDHPIRPYHIGASSTTVGAAGFTPSTGAHYRGSRTCQVSTGKQFLRRGLLPQQRRQLRAPTTTSGRTTAWCHCSVQ